ncbi:MAG TPA: hypothetical protein EYG66_07585 [Mariprofundaceae bacterium]|nr:hypothetical protein [Mariprofundaceae bacterium]
MAESMASRALSIESLTLLESLGQLRGLGTGLATKGSISAKEREKVIKLHVSVSLLQEQVISSLNEAVHISGEQEQGSLKFNVKDKFDTMKHDTF